MKRTYFTKNTITDDQNLCEFHPVEQLFNERILAPKENKSIKSFVRMKRFILPSIFLALVIAGCNNQTSQSKAEVTVPVRITTIEMKPIYKAISTNGTVSSVGEVDLKTESEGFYQLAKNPRTGKKFALGDIIKKGEVIVQLKNEEYENSIRIEAKGLDLDNSKSEYEKQKALYDKGGVTLRELKNAEISYVNTKYDFEKAKIQLEKLKVSSPFEGAIVNLPYFTDGTKINANVNVVSVMNYTKLVMEIDLPEKYISTITQGLTANITNYNLKNDTLQASITQLSPAIDNATRTFKGVMMIENPRMTFRPGMFVKADIVVEKRDSAIVIPREMITKSSRGKIVFVVDKNAAAEKVIRTGIENDTDVEVVSGLAVGDNLITEGYEMLRNRSKIKILK